MYREILYKKVNPKNTGKVFTVCSYMLFIVFLILVMIPAFIHPVSSQSPEADYLAASSRQQEAAQKLTRSESSEQRFSELRAKLQELRSVRVIVKLKVAFRPEGNIRLVERRVQRESIKKQQDALLVELQGYDPASVKRPEYVPYIGMSVNVTGLESLRQSSIVIDIHEDKPIPMALSASTTVVEAVTAWANGYSGTGQVVAILDTGVDKTHPFLAGKIVSEACFSTNNSEQLVSSLCLHGMTSSTEPDSGLNCTGVIGCDHGTHVAGIAAGKGLGLSGVARDANIISIQVFSRVDDPNVCERADANSPCLLAYPMDLKMALNHVKVLSEKYNIAAVNMSLGGGENFSSCDSEPLKVSVDELRSLGIATVIASGNNKYTNALGYPACISTAVSVGSTGSGGPYSIEPDKIANTSNSASFLHLLAPGVGIYSSIPGDYDYKSGTSMAAPHVAGAWAILKQKWPSASVSEILNALTSTGANIIDPRNGITKPRIRINAALGAASRCIVDVPVDRWKAEYFNNRDLTGSPVMVRDDGGDAINYDWGQSSPSIVCGLAIDNFSVRWTRTVSLGGGTYRFTVTGDDGVRLYVDGQLHIDKWFDQGPTTYQAEVALAAGNHEVKFEYYEHGGGAVARLFWEQVSVSVPGPVISAITPGTVTINQPATLTVNGSNFQSGFAAAVITTGGTTQLSGPALTYISSTQVRLQVTMGGTAPYTATLRITNPDGQIATSTFDVVAAGGCIGTVAPGNWRGEYFSNRNLAGSPVMMRDDGGGAINYDWGLGSPSSGCGLGGDNFSVRWTRTLSLAGGTYRFTATGDDGVRLYVDGQPRIDKWIDQAPTAYQADVVLTTGSHDLRFEYYENGGGAVARLSWEQISVSNPGPVISAITPGTVTVNQSATLTVNGSNFQAGFTAAVITTQGTFSIPGPAINFVSSTQVRVQVTMGGTAPYTATLRITNPDGQGATGIFDVVAGGGCIGSVAPGNWRGEYFSNRYLSGSPVMVRDDGGFAINYDWGLGSPSLGCGLGIDTFSVRWTRTVSLGGGTYRFTATGDDGVRLYVDGQLRIDKWIDQAPTAYQADVVLTTGNHDLRFEYYENGGGAVAGLSWEQISVSNPGPVISAITPGTVTVNQPATLTINGANFQSGFTAAVITSLGTFLIAGPALTFLNSTQVSVQVTMGGTAPYTATLRITNPDGQSATGTFNVVSGGGCIGSVSPGNWRGEYFSNRYLNGSPVMVRDDGGFAINYDWGQGSPSLGCGLGIDNFSVRWTRTLNLGAGTYQFTVTGDDGVRLYVDGQLRIDKWFDQGPTTYPVQVALGSGNHDIMFEYYENGGGALAQLSWVLVSASNPVPTIASLAPASVTSGGPAFILTISGTGFVPGSSARWSGADRPTTFISSNALSVQIQASDIVSQGVGAITVYNPSPGGGISNILNLNVVGSQGWTATGLNGEIISSMVRIGVYLFASTRERYIDGALSGIYRSADDGRNWTRVFAGLSNQSVTSMAVRGTTLYAGTTGPGLSGSVISSTDYGQNWTKIASGLPDKYVESLASNGTTLYAGLGRLLTSELGYVYRLSDNGQFWTRVFTAPPDQSVTQLAVNGSNVFAGTNGVGTTGRLYRSVDGGLSWTLVFVGQRNQYVNTISVIANQVLIGTSDFNALKTVYRSVNNGQTWTQVASGLSNMDVRAFSNNGSSIFAGTFGGGVFRSIDGGVNWMPVNDGLTNLRIISFTVKDSKLYAGGYTGPVFVLDLNTLLAFEQVASQ